MGIQYCSPGRMITGTSQIFSVITEASCLPVDGTIAHGHLDSPVDYRHTWRGYLMLVPYQQHCLFSHGKSATLYYSFDILRLYILSHAQPATFTTGWWWFRRHVKCPRYCAACATADAHVAAAAARRSSQQAAAARGLMAVATRRCAMRGRFSVCRRELAAISGRYFR